MSSGIASMSKLPRRIVTAEIVIPVESVATVDRKTSVNDASTSSGIPERGHPLGPDSKTDFKSGSSLTLFMSQYAADKNPGGIRRNKST
jgi:hypothetical protein